VYRAYCGRWLAPLLDPDELPGRVAGRGVFAELAERVGVRINKRVVGMMDLARARGWSAVHLDIFCSIYGLSDLYEGLMRV
jgi:hypothetical protein